MVKPMCLGEFRNEEVNDVLHQDYHRNLPAFCRLAVKLLLTTPADRVNPQRLMEILCESNPQEIEDVSNEVARDYQFGTLSPTDAHGYEDVIFTDPKAEFILFVFPEKGNRSN